MVTWYWSADTLFWQVSIDHNMDFQYQRGTLQTEGACLCQHISWSMAAILRDSVVVVVVFVRTCSRAIPLTMITMRKTIHGFPFLSAMGMGLRLTALRAAGAPLWHKLVERLTKVIGALLTAKFSQKNLAQDCQENVLPQLLRISQSDWLIFRCR